MSTFWRTELQRLVDSHRAAGHLVGGGPGLDPDHLDDWFWHVTEKANEESKTYGREEFLAGVRKVAERCGAAAPRRAASDVLAKAQWEREKQLALRNRRDRVLLRVAMRDRGIGPLTEAERAAVNRHDRIRAVLNTQL